MSTASNIAGRANQLSAADDDDLVRLEALMEAPEIGISNEFEYHLQMQELDEDGEEWPFLACSKEDRGLLKSQSVRILELSHGSNAV